MKSLFSILVLVSFLSFPTFGQNALDLKREADVLYKLEDFERAEELYRHSLALDQRPETMYNLGNTLYKLDRHEEAVQFFSQAKEMFAEKSAKSDAAHNLGNTFFEKMDLEKALDAFRESLIYNPANEDARNNYLLAKELMQMMPPSSSPHEGGEEDQDAESESDKSPDSMGEDQADSDHSEGDSDGRDEGSEEETQLSESSADELAESDRGEQDQEQILLEQLLELAEEEDQRTQRKMNEQRRQTSQILRDW